MQITKVYPLDAVFDNPDDVPEDVKKKSLDFFLVFNVRIYILMLMFFFCPEICIDKNKQAVRRIR